MGPDRLWRRVEEMRRAAEILLKRAAELEQEALGKLTENQVGSATVVYIRQGKPRVCHLAEAAYDLKTQEYTR